MKEYSINMFKGSNSCIFSFTWDDSDQDMLDFLTRVYYIPAPKLKAECCKICGRMLSIAYIYIIEMLDEAGLLPKSFIPMCCYCNILACVGFYIPDEWEGTRISEGFSTVKNTSIIHVTGFYIPTKEHFSFKLRIDNVNLALKTGSIFNDVGFH